MYTFQVKTYPRSRFIVGFALLFSIVMIEATKAQAASPRSIDDSDTVMLRGNVHPLTRTTVDAGATSWSLPMEHLILVLKRSTEKQAALTRLLAEQQDPASENFHRWLTPDEFGARFGHSSAEVATVADWLRSYGFVINEISHSRSWINFSGTAGDLNRAFQAEIHDFSLTAK
jgi:subtilase family serine protease